ncbi:hypothetical protein M0802_013513 [Mischocyttarus mexicanus]|nr:hypothetical protein M0802_013513 [Mischocyttarus mexicanus]
MAYPCEQASSACESCRRRCLASPQSEVNEDGRTCREVRFYDVIGPRVEVPGTNPVTGGYLTTRKILQGLRIPPAPIPILREP